MPGTVEPAILRFACESANENVGDLVDDYPPKCSELEGMGPTCRVSELLGHLVRLGRAVQSLRAGSRDDTPVRHPVPPAIIKTA